MYINIELKLFGYWRFFTKAKAHKCKNKTYRLTNISCLDLMKFIRNHHQNEPFPAKQNKTICVGKCSNVSGIKIWVFRWIVIDRHTFKKPQMCIAKPAFVWNQNRSHFKAEMFSNHKNILNWKTKSQRNFSIRGEHVN